MRKLITILFLIPLFCSSQFVGILSSSSGGGSGLDSNSFWKIHGNSGTDPLVNFIGTTNQVDLVFKVNGELSGAIQWGDLGSIEFPYGNTSFGWSSLVNNLEGNRNTALGYYALSDDSIGSNNTAIGYGANVLTKATRSSIALGYTAMASSNQFAISDSIFNLKFNLNGQTNGYVLTTNGTTADWQSFVGTPIKDSIDATGATVSPAINTTHVITSAGAITSATLSFPSGTTGNWIIVVFNKAIATLTNSGTGATTVGLVAPLLGTSKTYVNINGLWY
jgi:hypothetical protein